MGDSRYVHPDELRPVDDSTIEFDNGGHAQLQVCSHRGRRYLFKRYRAAHLAELDEAALLRLVTWRLELPPELRRELDARVAWPRHLVRSGAHLRGVMIPVAHQVFFYHRTPATTSPRTLYRLLPTTHRPAAPVGRKLSAFSQVIETVLWLHEHGVIVGDLQPDNILIASGGAAAYLVDCDSMLSPAWGQVSPPAAPSLLDDAIPGATEFTAATDLAKLAITLVRTLVDDPALITVGLDVRRRLAELLPADTVSFLLGATRPLATTRTVVARWRALAGAWRATGARGSATVPGRPPPGSAPPIRPRSDRRGWLPPDFAYRPDPLPESFLATQRRAGRTRWAPAPPILVAAAVFGSLSLVALALLIWIRQPDGGL